MRSRRSDDFFASARYAWKSSTSPWRAATSRTVGREERIDGARSLSHAFARRPASATRAGSSPSFATNGTSEARRSCVSSSSPGLRLPAEGARARAEGVAHEAPVPRPHLVRDEEIARRRGDSLDTPRRRAGPGRSRRAGTSARAVAIGTSPLRASAATSERRRDALRRRQVASAVREHLLRGGSLVEHAVVARSRRSRGRGQDRRPEARARPTPRSEACTSSRRRGRPSRAQTGTCQVSFVEPVEPVGRKRFCERRSAARRPCRRARPSRAGRPAGRETNEMPERAAGFFAASAIDATKSSDVALPHACAFR